MVYYPKLRDETWASLGSEFKAGGRGGSSNLVRSPLLHRVSSLFFLHLIVQKWKSYPPPRNSIHMVQMNAIEGNLLYKQVSNKLLQQ